MEETAHWSLICEVLLAGPADGSEILEHIKCHELWETLYSASRSSPYASIWREAFGRERINQPKPRSVLLLAAHTLVDTFDDLISNQQHNSILLLSKFIANCCAENVNARRGVIKTGILQPLLEAIQHGLDSNTLIPAIYNVCTELEDEEDQVLTDLTVDYRNVTLFDAETRLARGDAPEGSVYTGLTTLLQPDVIGNTTDEILEYLTELLDMVSKAVSIAQLGHIAANDEAFWMPLTLLLSQDGGRKLARRSQLCHNAVCRAILAVTTSQDAKTFVASHGLILEVLLVAGPPGPPKNADTGDNDTALPDFDDTRVHIEAVREQQKSSLLRLTYAIAQLPQFEQNISYGIAREALRIVNRDGDQYINAVAYIMLYTFVNSEQRAHLLIGEGLLVPLYKALQTHNDLQVIHPASALLARCASMWSLKPRLVDDGAFQVVRRLLLASNMGFEIPSTAVMIIELLIKGHPNHVQLLLDPSKGSTVLDDVIALFEKGNQSLCLDVGRLMMEICATLGASRTQSVADQSISLEWFVQACPEQKLVDILTFVAQHATHDDTSTSRIWYALGLLAVTDSGRRIVQAVTRDVGVSERMSIVESQGGFLSENVKFVKLHVSRAVQVGDDGAASLDQSMKHMSIV